MGWASVTYYGFVGPMILEEATDVASQVVLSIKQSLFLCIKRLINVYLSLLLLFFRVCISQCINSAGSLPSYDSRLKLDC